VKPFTRVPIGKMERVRGYTRAGVRKAIMMGLIAVMATVFGVSSLIISGCTDQAHQQQFEQQGQMVDETKKVISESGEIKMEDIDTAREPLPPTDLGKREEYLRQKRLEEAYARIDKLEGGTGRIYGTPSWQQREPIHKLRIGMSDYEVRDLLSTEGTLDINRSVGAWGVHEQWVYRATPITLGIYYLYFQNGVLTSWQQTR